MSDYRVPYPPPVDERRVQGALRAARAEARERAGSPGRGVPGALEDIARYIRGGLADTYNAGRRAVMEDPLGAAGGMAWDLLSFPATREIAGGLGAIRRLGGGRRLLPGWPQWRLRGPTGRFGCWHGGRCGR